MTMHLIKLSVGPDALSDLADWQTQRLRELKRAGEKPELVHITRQTPKRAGELLDGGSIYWVIKGWLCARQRLLELRPLVRDGVPHCGLVYDRELIRVRPRKHRPFQGWRYFDPKDAPPDLRKGSGEEEMPEEMRRELSELGLL
jgi:hypothetical protein